MRAHDWRRCCRLTNHNSCHPDLLALSHHAQGEIREIDDDICLAQTVRQPPPTFHVGDNNVDASIRLAAANFRSLSLVGIKATVTKFRQFGFEREVTLGVGLVSVKRRTDIRDFHETRENLAWIRRAAVVKNIATHARPMYAAD